MGNRLESATLASTWRNRDACLFLSTRPAAPDAKGILLKKEIKSIAEDVASRRLLAAPSLQRDPDDWAQRVRVIYGCDDPREFTTARLAAESQP